MKMYCSYLKLNKNQVTVGYLNVKYDTFSFNLYLSTVFLTFKYSTVFISLLGTIYFNLIITFFIYVEVSTVQCSCSNCVFTIF